LDRRSQPGIARRRQRQARPRRQLQLLSRGRYQHRRLLLQHSAPHLRPQPRRNRAHSLRHHTKSGTRQRNLPASSNRCRGCVRSPSQQRSNRPALSRRLRRPGQTIPRHQRVRLQARCRQPPRLSRRRAHLSRQSTRLSPGSCQLHDRARAVAPGRRHKDSAMRKTFVANVILSFAALATGLVATGCGSGPAESESKMTSYSGTESKADTASLFIVPQDQMAHIQVVAVEKTKLPRLLRLTGNATYNAFKTTPVFSAIGGPVHEILVAPGQTVHAGQPLLTVNSPDYSAARSAYIKARDAYSLAEKIYNRAQDLYAHGAIAEADLQQAESVRTQSQADMQSSEDALRALGLNDPEAVVKNPPKMTSQIPIIAPVAGEIVE